MRQVVSLNRSGKIGQSGGPIPLEPTIAQVQQQPDAAPIPFDVHLIGLAGDRLRTVGFDQLEICKPGSVFALLCKDSPLGQLYKDVFFISQLLGTSAEFSTSDGDSFRTVWLRTIRRPGQLGPYSEVNRVDMLNVKISAAAVDSEVFFLPAVQSFFMDPSASGQKYSASGAASMAALSYLIMPAPVEAPEEGYELTLAPGLAPSRLEIASSTPITSDLIYNPITYTIGTDPDVRTAYADGQVLGLIALARVDFPPYPQTNFIGLLWSCLHKPASSPSLDSQFLVSNYTDIVAIQPSVAATKEGEKIVSYKEYAYSSAM